MSVETEVKAVEAEVVKVEGEVIAEVKKVVEEVKAEVKQAIVTLTAEEKLAIREIEVVYLKAQGQIQSLSQATQKAQADFTKIVEDLTKKYLISPSEYVFDNVSLLFRKK
jgi:copper chaperone CopZ